MIDVSFQLQNTRITCLYILLISFSKFCSDIELNAEVVMLLDEIGGGFGLSASEMFRNV